MSPQRNQIIDPAATNAATLAAAREENDKDQTVVDVAQLRARQHQASTRCASAGRRKTCRSRNPCFNGNGRDQAACEPTLAFQTFTDQQNTTAQARVNDAYPD